MKASPKKALSESIQLETQAVSWVELILELASSIVKIEDVPLFTKFKILEFQDSGSPENKYHVIFVSTGTALIPDLLRVAIGEAISLALWTSRLNIDNPDDRRSFRKMAEEGRHRFLEKAWASKSVAPRVWTFQTICCAQAMDVPSIGLPDFTYQLGWGIRSRLLSHSATDLDSAFGDRIATYKHKTSEWLKLSGLPVPDHKLVTSIQVAEKAAEQIGFPLVVKPVDADRGEGVSVDVTGEILEAAISKAIKWSRKKQALVESQIPGVVHRVWICRGELLYVIKRLPVGIYSDGSKTIRALFKDYISEQRKLPPWERNKVTELDSLAL